MKLYADAPTRRTRQLLADVLFVLWIVGWVWIGHVVQQGTMELAGVGRQTDASATSLANGLTSAGDTLSGRTTVLETRTSRSRPDVGILRLRQEVFNQTGERVMWMEHPLLFRRRSPA